MAKKRTAPSPNGRKKQKRSPLEETPVDHDDDEELTKDDSRFNTAAFPEEVESSSDDDDEDDDDDVVTLGDDDEDDEEEEAERLRQLQQQQQQRAGKQSKRFVPPTSDELLHLKETQDLFKSNLFRLQISELLSEVTICKGSAKTETLLRHLKKALDSLEERNINIEEYATLYPSVHVHNKSDKRITFRFRKPASTFVVGSFLLKTAVKPSLNVDIAVEVPSSSFKAHDLINHRYADKRALYLAVLAEQLKENELFGDVKFTAFRGDFTKPILTVRPPKSAGSHFTLRIIPFLSPSCIQAPLPKDSDTPRDNIVFKLNRLLPDRNNCRRPDVVVETLRRQKRAERGDDDEAMSGEEEEEYAATPYYNNAILEDVMYVRHLTLLHSHIGSLPALRDAICLLKVWLRQRHSTLHSGDTFNGFLFSMLLVHLLQERKVNKSMSSYQMFKLTLEFIAHNDVLSRGLFMKQDSSYPHSIDASGNEDIRRIFLESFEVVFLDPTGRLNLASRVTRGGWLDLKRDAQLSLDALDDHIHDRFDDVFMLDVPFHLKYDNVILVKKSPPSPVDVLESRVARANALDAKQQRKKGGKQSEKNGGKRFSVSVNSTDGNGDGSNLSSVTLSATDLSLVDAMCSHGGNWRRALCAAVARSLARGLGDRAIAIRVHFTPPPVNGGGATKRTKKSSSSSSCVVDPFAWSIDQTCPALAALPIWIGISVDATHSRRIVDKGPSADAARAVKEWKEFWGDDKAEVRRFRDGSILETVVWECPLEERHGIVKRIVEHTLNRHHSIQSEDTVYLNDQLDPLLAPLAHSTCLFDTKGHLEVDRDWTAEINSSFNRLSEQIRHVDGLPLVITSVSGVSPAFRFADPAPPPPLTHLRHLLNNPSSSSSSSSPHVDASSLNVAPLEVVLQMESSGMWPEDLRAIQALKSAFYVKMGDLLTEQCSLETRACPLYLDVFADGFVYRLFIFYHREPALLRKAGHQVVAAEIERSYVQRVQHASSLRGFHLRHIEYGPTVRLVKRWLHAHLFTDCLRPELVELMVASLFTAPSPFAAPNARFSAFIRFLRLLAWGGGTARTVKGAAGPGSDGWSLRPLVVDVDNDLTAQDYKRINDLFDTEMNGASSKDTSPSMPLFVATPTDLESSWTRHLPDRIAFSRMQALARQSLRCIESSVNAAASFAVADAVATTTTTAVAASSIDDTSFWLSLFRPPVGDFDLEIKVRGDCVANSGYRMVTNGEWTKLKKRSAHRVNANTNSKSKKKGAPKKGGDAAAAPGGRYKNLLPSYLGGAAGSAGNEIDRLLIGFNPVHSFVNQLRVRFGEIACFFYDGMGGDSVYVVWRPEARAVDPFRVAHSTLRQPVRGGGGDDTDGRGRKRKRKDGGCDYSLQVNIEQVIAELWEMGQDLVVEVKRLK
eukprot:TRINITY_DN739_c0_g2_i1.p1 TRINITY_DN739_c0_g2~~TRINITY_DN739_c0_g2_i1.p1  ORF type:complete len:1406 (+),score=464.94 TRINITY_DN739_c0_g2_i1:163-4380(+)